MILKIPYKSHKGGFKLIDHISTMSYETVPYQQVALFENDATYAANEIIHNSESFDEPDDLNGVLITVKFCNNDTHTVFITGTVYVLNDNGKTIERL